MHTPPRRPPEPAINILDQPCIAVFRSEETQYFTVADYDALKRQRTDQPIWAWAVPPVYELTDEPSARWGARVVDRGAYVEQMRRLMGLL